MLHNENSRVKIPALVHFTRLGYEYLSLKNYSDKNLIDEDTNIFIDLLCAAINRINGIEYTLEDTQKLVNELKLVLDNEDIGRAFYFILLNGYKGIKLIDFEDSVGEKNSFHVVTELTYKNGTDEFRPDVTVLVNGLPLAFIEVKKPNNKNGIKAEYDRMNARVQNKKFRRFINLTQIMVFSNNSPYDDSEVVPLEGSFYAASGYKKLFFSHFREEDTKLISSVPEADEETENFILKDNNLVSIKHTPEYIINRAIDTPTNSIITSLFSFERFLTFIKYAVAYVEKTDENGITHLEKHLMRYPQFFATKAIEYKLNQGVKNGIIWHTQGSGKTALAFFNVRYLTDYYQKKGVIAKFYFVVDRLDLLTQAANELRARGLEVEEINSKEEFIKNIQTTGTSNNTGKLTITVVNIQKFSKDSIVKHSDYAVNVQRVYFLDEAHRSYKPTGSFLANLLSSDREAVMIALTGTPLIGTIYDDNGKPIAGKKYDSKAVFGNYIHKYYYNRSIADGYTLRLIREGISTTYKKKIQEALENLEMQKGSLQKKEMYAHPSYVTPLVEYIVEDFQKTRIALNDDTVGGMIVCDSSDQAKVVFEKMQSTGFSSALILHDVDDKETRQQHVTDFKKGTLDFLIVYNMLLTGFDAPRLKKLYLGRVIKDHNLLQALTRVNRPYKNYRYGYVVDFADIRAEFDKTNKAYFDELQAELGDAFRQYDNIFKSPEEIVSDLEAIKEKLFLYDTSNAEIFSQQISAVDDKKELLELRHVLETYRELFNVSKLFGYDEISDHFDLEKISAFYNEVCNRIDILNQKQVLEEAQDMSAILNLALDQIEFHFKKVSEKELVIADKFRETLESTRKAVQGTLDPKDPEYITLLEELQRLLAKKNIEELTVDEMTANMAELERIKKEAERLNHADNMLAAKYEGDVKYMRTHKRLRENPPPIANDIVINQILLSLKHHVDDQIIANSHLLDNEPYFMQGMFPLIKQEFDKHHLKYSASQVKYVGTCISNEYFTERNFAS